MHCTAGSPQDAQTQDAIEVSSNSTVDTVQVILHAPELNDSVLLFESCGFGYRCDTNICPTYDDCQIIKKINAMVKSRYNQYNYGRGHNHDHQRNGRLHKHAVRHLLLSSLRRGFKCPDCNTRMILGGDLPESATLDHISARAEGGKNNLENLRVCCWSCNQIKSRSENRI